MLINKGMRECTREQKYYFFTSSPGQFHEKNPVMFIAAKNQPT